MTGIGKLKSIAKEHPFTEMRLIVVRGAAGGGPLGQVLRSLRDAFHEQVEQTRELRGRLSPEYQYLADDLGQPSQHALFGAALVTCQAYINALSRTVLEFRKYLIEELELAEEECAIPEESWELFELGGYGLQIRAFHELANYFKHVEEWTDEQWERPDAKKHRSTYYTISFLKEQLGLAERHPGFLEEAARKLRIAPGILFDEIGRYFDEWASYVADVAEQQAAQAAGSSAK